MGYASRVKYNWQLKDWPGFHYDLKGMEEKLFAFSEKAGRADGMLHALSPPLQTETLLETMISEAVKTSEIEGEYVSRVDVMSSIKHNLGLAHQGRQIGDKRAEGIAELMTAIRNGVARPLTQSMLFSWHKMLMKGTRRVKRGGWRTHNEPMRIVSGPLGSEQIHFEAPPSATIPTEMKQFIRWFNATAPGGASEIKRPPVRSAITHLYFESIHPFEDGNGRIGRALSKKALFQGLGHPIPISLSCAIEAHKVQYYAALKTGQRSNDITPWIAYFVQMLLTAQEQAEALIQFTLGKAKLFDRVGGQLNERQLKALRRMLKAGLDGFEGGMSAQKYISITGTTKATATRDLKDMVEKQILLPRGGGRSVRYQIRME